MALKKSTSQYIESGGENMILCRYGDKPRGQLKMTNEQESVVVPNIDVEKEGA